MEVKFIEKSHQYLSERGELISVSAFVERFKPHVDWGKKAIASAKRLTREGTPTTAKELLDKWENKRNRASAIGSLYHYDREQELLGDKGSSFYDKKCSKKPCIHKGDLKYSIPINNIENDTVYPELIIYDFEHMLSGQSDKVIVVNNTIHIWDYKTDAELKYKGYSDKWNPNPQKMLKPVEHLDDCNINHYSLKMSLYMYMLWKANKGRFKPGEIIIEHVKLKRDPNNDNLPVTGKDGRPKIGRAHV